MNDRIAVEGASAAARAFSGMYNVVLVILGICLLFCLLRAILGPRTSDRIVTVNMMGTLVVIIICVLSFLMQEDSLVDIAMIYTMLSFLAVILLTRIYMGSWREKHYHETHPEKEEKQ